MDKIFPCFGNRRILEEMRILNARLSHLEERMTILSNYSIDQGIILEVPLSPGLKPGALRCTSAPTTRMLSLHSPPATRETGMTEVTGEIGATREVYSRPLTGATRVTGDTREVYSRPLTRETGENREVYSRPLTGETGATGVTRETRGVYSHPLTEEKTEMCIRGMKETEL